MSLSLGFLISEMGMTKWQMLGGLVKLIRVKKRRTAHATF